MTKFIAIASSKGGSGKTTVALNLGVTLTNFGREVAVIDANFTAPHLGLHLGSPLLPHSLHDVLKGVRHITESVYSHASGLKVVPLHISLEELRNSDLSLLKQAFEGMKNRFEAVIVDTPSGISRELEHVFKAVDEVILVTTPDMLGVTEAMKTKRLAESAGAKVLGIVVNRLKKDKIDLTIKNIEYLLGLPVLEYIPEDDCIRLSLHMKHPVAYSHPDSKATSQFKKLAAKLIGERYVENLEKQENESRYTKLLKFLGFK